MLTLDASIVQDDQPLEVVPKVYVGSIHSAFNMDILIHKGITHILNASRIPGTFPKEFTYLSVEIRDKDDSNLLACIPTTNIFIEAGIDHGGILVHCFGGKSRSPAFICAYLMSTCHWTFDQAYTIVKQARPSVDINIGFECQLRAYEAAQYDVYIAQQLLLRARIRDLHLLRGDKALLVGHFVPIQPHNQSTVQQSSADKDPPAPMFISSKQQRFDSVSAAEHWRSSDSPSMMDITTPTLQQKRNNITLQRGRSALNNELSEDAGSSMDVDNNTDGEESSVYRSPLGKAPSCRGESALEQQQHAQEVDMEHGRAKALKMEIVTQPSSDNVGGNVNLEDSLDSQVSKESISSSSSHQTNNNNNNSSYPSNDFVQSLSKVPVNFHTGSGGSGGKTSRHRKHQHSHHGHGHGHQSGRSTNKNPSCRLSRPGNNWVRVIPPLRGLEREFKCSWCNFMLFQLSSVIRQDIKVTGMIDNYLQARQACFLRQLTTDPSLREDPEEQFLAHKSKSSNSHSTSSSTGGKEKEGKFNETLMAALKKSTSNMRLLQLNAHHSPHGNNSEHQHSVSFLPPISNHSTNNNSGSSTYNPHYAMSVSAPVSVARSSSGIKHFQPPSHSRHNTSSNMDFSGSSNSKMVEDDEEDDANMSSFPMPLMTTRHAKSQAKGFNFGDDDTTTTTNTNSTGNHGGSSLLAPTFASSKQSSFQGNIQNHSSNSPAAPPLGHFTPQPSSERLFTPRQLLQQSPSNNNLNINNTFATSNDSNIADPVSTNSSPRLTFSKHNHSIHNTLLPSIANSAPTVSFGNSNTNVYYSESTPPPTMQSFSTNSVERSRSTSPRATMVLNSTNPPNANNNSTSNRNINAHHPVVMMSASERQPSQQALMGHAGSSLPRIISPRQDGHQQSNRPNSAGASFSGSFSTSSNNIHQPNDTSFAHNTAMLLLTNTSNPTNNVNHSNSNHSTVSFMGNRSVSGSFDESPRVVIPPTKMFEGCSAFDRPHSAEKLRWLARAALLVNNNSNNPSNNTSNNSNTVHTSSSFIVHNSDNRVVSLAEKDDLASNLVFDADPYFYVEYLEWMGKDIFHLSLDSGDLCCPQCKHVIGSWTWTPSMRMSRNGNLEAPLFRIHKSIVHHTDLDFDATPSATPRLSEDF